MTSGRAANLREISEAVRPLVTVSAASWKGKSIPERRWLVHDMIPEGVVTMLSGDGGIGKSLLALQLAAAVAGGFDWIGTVPECGTALYLSAEDELDEAHRRTYKILQARSLDFDAVDRLHVASLAGEDAVLAAPEGRSAILSTTALWRGLEARLNDLGPSLLVLDNLADVFGGDEVSRREARQFVGLLRGLAIRHSMSVLLLAHPSLSGLSSGSGTSGSTAWSNSVRSRLYLDRPKADDADPDQRVLRVMKANHAAIGAETKLRWRAGVFETEGLGPTGYDRAAAEAQAEDRFMQLLARLTDQGRNVSDKTGTTYAPAIFAKEDRSIASKAFERAMYSLFSASRIKVVTEGPESRRRSRIVVV